MRIVLTGGGTAGHLTPLIAVARALSRMDAAGEFTIPARRNGGVEVIYVGVVTPLARELLEAAGIPYRHVPSGKIRRYASGAGLTGVDMLARLPIGILRALWRMYVLMPDVVFSKGGYGAIPVVLSAWLYRIPVLLHETDAVAGLANRRLARFASSIALGLARAKGQFPPARSFVSGTPLREVFRSPPSRADAHRALNLHDRKPVLFVTGGSQGSRRINAVILELLPRLLPDVQVLHQAGAQNLAPIQELIMKDFRDFPDIRDYRVVGFLDGKMMATFTAAADLVVCRAGGTTLAELAAVGKPAILIPLRESASNHQWENAYVYREAGAALVMDEANVSPPLLESSIRKLLERPEERARMASRMRALARPRAAEELARVLVAMGLGYAPRMQDGSRTSSTSPA